MKQGVSKAVIAFYFLAGLATCVVLPLIIFAHFDMAQMRTVRPGFNFDGIIAFGSAMLVSGGLVVLFVLWRIMAFEKSTASRDLTVWIGVLCFIFITLHLMFIISFGVDEWINAPKGQSPAQSLWRQVKNSETMAILIALLWPLPAIYGLAKYRKNVQLHPENSKNISFIDES